MANRVTGAVADATAYQSDPQPSSLHAPTILELAPWTASDQGQLDVRSREGDDELLKESHSDLGTQLDRVRVLLPRQREVNEECYAIRKTFEQ